MRDSERAVQKKEAERKEAVEDQSGVEASEKIKEYESKLKELEEMNQKLEEEKSSDAQELKLLKMQVKNSVDASTELGKKHAKEKRALVAHANELEKRLSEENLQIAEDSKKLQEQVKAMELQLENLTREKSDLVQQLAEIPKLKQKLDSAHRDADDKFKKEKQALVVHSNNLEDQLKIVKKISEQAMESAKSKIHSLEKQLEHVEGNKKKLEGTCTKVIEMEKAIGKA